MIRATGGLTQESHEVFADADLYARALGILYHLQKFVRII